MASPDQTPRPRRTGPIIGLLAVVVFVGICVFAFTSLEPAPTDPPDETGEAQ